MLTQLGLAYFVEDGILVITSEDSAKTPLPPSMAGPTPLERMIEKGERGELSSTELKELIEVVKLSQQVRSFHDNAGTGCRPSAPLRRPVGRSRPPRSPTRRGSCSRTSAS